MNALRLGRAVFDALDLPTEALSAAPQILLEGNRRARVENHRGILEYAPELLRIQTSLGILIITGQALTVRVLTPQFLLVEGEIQSLLMQTASTDTQTAHKTGALEGGKA